MSSITVLIVDDTRSARRTAVLATELLEEELGVAITALTAETGIEGAQHLREQPHIDLVVLDIHLPGRDVDGRMLGALTRELHPHAHILPFTADRSPSTAAELEALGMDAPVVKPIAPRELANRIRHALQQPVRPASAPLQTFLANQTLQMVELLEQGASPDRPRIALVAEGHLLHHALTNILAEVNTLLPFVLVSQTGGIHALSAALQRGEIRLLVCPTRELRVAENLAQAYQVPILVYSVIEDAEEALERPWSVVVGPTCAAELAQAIKQTLDGKAYRNPYAADVVRLTERQRTILPLIVQGRSTAEIAKSVGISPDWARHVIGDIYDNLGLPHTRAALLNWAQSAPLHLITQRQS